MAIITLRRLLYTSGGALLLLASALVLHVGGPGTHTISRDSSPPRKYLRLLQSASADMIAQRAGDEAAFVANETSHASHQLSGVLPGGRFSPPA